MNSPYLSKDEADDGRGGVLAGGRGVPPVSPLQTPGRQLHLGCPRRREQRQRYVAQPQDRLNHPGRKLTDQRGLLGQKYKYAILVSVLSSQISHLWLQ